MYKGFYELHFFIVHFLIENKPKKRKHFFLCNYSEKKTNVKVHVLLFYKGF